MSKKKVDVEVLAQKINNLSLGDLLTLCGQAVNMNLPEKKIDILLKHLDLALLERKLKKLKSRI